MNNKNLMLLIDKLNKKKDGGLIHLRPLSSNVDFAKVWPAKPKLVDNIFNTDEPDKFYFIKNSEGTFIAIVLDMSNDLHWFVEKKHRQQGHLTKAMKETILFHLFQDREEQKITINEKQIGKKYFIASENVALSLGFIKINDNDYKITKEKFHTENFIYGQNTQFAEERLQELKKQINYLSRCLLFIHSEVEMKLGASSYTEELKELANKIKKNIHKLEDKNWEIKNTTR